MERRFINATETRVVTREDGKKVIRGYGAVFYDGTPGSEYTLWRGVKERIMPGAFTRALAEGDDVRGAKNHDPNLLLGRTSAGTMRLSEDERGLLYEIDPPDTQTGRDTVVEIERGDLTGSSFAFQVEREEWVKTDEGEIRLIRSVKPLYDVGPVTFPAYKGTTAGVRNEADAAEAKESLKKWNESLRRASSMETAVKVRRRLAELGI